MADTAPALVSTEWLAEHLSAPDIRIVDASWHLPDQGRDAKAEYREAHIPGAVFFDMDDICDQDCALPHMLPSAAKMASRMRKLGIGDGNRVIVYDNSDLRSAARAWYMLKCYGLWDVAILDGGFQKWKKEHRETEDIPPIPRERHFTARFDTTRVRDLRHMLRNIETSKEQVIDARAPGRFSGQDPEPRPGMKSGHIPGSLNVCFRQLLRPEDGTFKSPDEIRRTFEDAGVDLKKPLVTSCGSGVTAAVLSLGLYLIGHRDNALYDGSWAEWGSHPETPVETQ
ncbi:3-mercaptopyruvate sulfurtransferase [Paremcibacter congregatus]|uniref:3-mercaptopyruvate sulfurtransferase n=1 Tax=Paremcibacter congregatus TaxID=2043170 RepID=UPI003A8F83E5